MKKKIISLVLAAAMAIPLAFPTAAGTNGNLQCGEPQPTDLGLTLNKSVSYNNGKYTVNLEAYDPGQTSVIKKPSTVILVLDESSSMNEEMTVKTDIDHTGDTLKHSKWEEMADKQLYFCPDNSADRVKIEISSFTIWDTGYYMYYINFSEGKKSFRIQNITGSSSLNLSTEIKNRFGKSGKIIEVKTSSELKEDVLKARAKTLLQKLREDALANHYQCDVAVVAYSDNKNSCIFTKDNINPRMNFNESFKDSDITYQTCFFNIADENIEDYNKLTMQGGLIDSLSPRGNSKAEEGLYLAEKILSKINNGDNENIKNNKKSVIFMSDGAPSDDGDYFTESFATGAIKFPVHWENGTISGVTFNHPEYFDTKTFSLGIVESQEYSTNLPAFNQCLEEKYDYRHRKYYEINLKNCANRFLNLVSSNYPNATQFSASGERDNSGSYYYNSETNFNDFISAIKTRAFVTDTRQIAATTLNESSIVKDYVSQYFKLPDGFKTGDVTVKTVKCTGKDNNGNFTFANAGEKLNATVTADNNNVNVSGFSFKDNFCSKTAKADGTYGKKLVISFEIVPNDGFLGGNNVPTNKDNSGVYSGNDYQAFEVPTANVAIKSENLNKAVNIYAGNAVPKLEDYFTLSSAYSYASWVDDFVYIAIQKSLSTSLDRPNYEAYIASVTLTPKYQPSSASVGPQQTKKTSKYSLGVTTFIPRIPCADTTIYLGEKANSFVPYNIKDNSKDLNDIEWYDGSIKASASTMLGKEPSLSYTFDKSPDFFESDTPVNVTKVVNNLTNADITNYATTENTASQPTGSEFTIHVKTCKLTINKVFNTKYPDDNETFIFNIKGTDNNKNNPLAKKININVVVSKGDNNSYQKTIAGLPIGNYTVTEEGKWSWRYGTNPVNVQITTKMPSDIKTLEIRNTLNNSGWMNGFAKASNVFEVKEETR